MNASTRSARVVVEALLASGVRDVVLCPGSRSAPLAYALHEAELAGLLRLHVRHDERSAGFCALGFGKASDLAAVVTTSGIAVANLHPAVLEAHHADVPLLVLSADRPHSLRGTWANQTSDLQAGLFGGAVRVAADLAAEDGERWRQAVVSAVRTARGAGGRRPGPVHLNLAFDDPLTSTTDDVWPVDVGLVTREGELPSAEDDVALPSQDDLPDGPRTVVVAGDGAGAAARWLAEARGWPLLAEPSSNARSGPNAVGPYRLLLDLEGLGRAVERTVVLGRPTLSRPVTRLLARPGVDVVLVASRERPGPGREVRRLAPPTAAAWSGSQPAQAPVRPDDWLSRWLSAAKLAGQAVDDVLDSEAERAGLNGPLVAREVAAAAEGTARAAARARRSHGKYLCSPSDRFASPEPFIRRAREGSNLVAAASNAVRDLDLAAAPFGDPFPRVLANRGVSGIDGTISTATGVALATDAPTRVLVGDLAFLHDLGGLAVPATERDRLRLQVVVPNDDGGGIFATLEHGEPGRARHFERVFGTPHGSDLAALCRGFDVPYERVDDVPSLRKALADVPRGLSLVEVPVDRSRLRSLHERIRRAVDAAVAGKLR
ncbi:MAG: 2-succinyl-5-enolpyruvyl-6-hydroxy-3-cyclohexene-1-carboxylic-acid synthase [Actinomycetes bacterium]